MRSLGTTQTRFAHPIRACSDLDEGEIRLAVSKGSDKPGNHS
jgi:hypothetical protein